MGEEAPASFGGIIEVVPRVLATDFEMGVPTEGIGVTPFISVDVEMVEMALAVTLPALPIIVGDEKVQVVGLPSFVVSAEPIIAEVAKEEPIMASSPVIKAVAGVLSATIEVLKDKVLREVEVPIMASLPPV